MRLFVWGTGRLSGGVVDKWIPLNTIECFIDNDSSKNEFMGKPVYSPHNILEKTYDAIVIANEFSKEIRQQCSDIGIDLSKVIFLYRNIEAVDFNQDYEFVESILGKQFSEIVKSRHHVIRAPEPTCGTVLTGSRLSCESYYETDFVRASSFELCLKEIEKKGLKGAVAEVGVFRGEFAQFINFSFPNSRLYLFDTFNGFDDKEALLELNSGNGTKGFIEAYKDTDIARVLEKMEYPENVVIKQGLFPDSLDGLEDRFIFVSLDVDYENSTFEGLKYFYPRLVEGGYIFIHDYNNSGLRGVEKAVDRYEKSIGHYLCRVPICDANGTLIITK